MSSIDDESRSGSSSGSETESQAGDEQWDDWNDSEGAEEEEATKSLFSEKVLKSPEEAFDHDAQHHGFDIRQFAIQVISPRICCMLVHVHPSCT